MLQEHPGRFCSHTAQPTEMTREESGVTMRLMLTRLLRLLLPCLLIIAALSGGCAQTRRYNVQVLNQTDEPITIGLAKEGGPYEPHLASPEEVAVGTPA